MLSRFINLSVQLCFFKDIGPVKSESNKNRQQEAQRGG
jgi:hypothetical protein